MGHKFEADLYVLITAGLLKSFTIDNVSEDGVVGEQSKFRSTEMLTLVFPNDQKVRISMISSGCNENTSFADPYIKSEEVEG